MNKLKGGRELSNEMSGYEGDWRGSMRIRYFNRVSYLRAHGERRQKVMKKSLVRREQLQDIIQGEVLEEELVVAVLEDLADKVEGEVSREVVVVEEVFLEEEHERIR